MSNQGRSLNVVLGEGVSANAVSLKITEGLSFADWRRSLEQALAMGGAAAWWIGDALAYGEWHYGTKYREVLSELEVEYDRIRDYAYVAGNVPPAIRRRDLTWMHHRVVAKLIPAEQERWLARAAQLGWPYRRLAEEIAQATAIASGETAGRSAVVELQQLRVTVPIERAERWQAAADRVDSSLEDWMAAVLDVAAAESETA